MSVAPAALFCLRAQVHFLCTQGARVQPAPGIPCALWIQGAELIFKTRANSCRENADSHLKNWTPSLRSKRYGGQSQRVRANARPDDGLRVPTTDHAAFERRWARRMRAFAHPTACPGR